LDPLLQISTREFLGAELERLGAESGIDQPLSLLWIDLDKFKQVNNLHGHEAGDEVVDHLTRQLAFRLRRPLLRI
jgi:diguanylate cyclase (GGDEF)-like protein